MIVVFFRGIFSTKFWFNRTSKIGAVEGVSVGVMKDYKLKLRDLRASHTLWSSVEEKKRKKKKTFDFSFNDEFVWWKNVHLGFGIVRFAFD